MCRLAGEDRGERHVQEIFSLGYYHASWRKLVQLYCEALSSLPASITASSANGCDPSRRFLSIAPLCGWTRSQAITTTCLRPTPYITLFRHTTELPSAFNNMVSPQSTSYSVRRSFVISIYTTFVQVRRKPAHLMPFTKDQSNVKRESEGTCLLYWICGVVERDRHIAVRLSRKTVHGKQQLAEELTAGDRGTPFSFLNIYLKTS